MDSTTVALIVSAFMPVLVSFLKRLHYDATLNAVIAMLVYAVAGTLYVLVSGQAVDVNNLVPTIAIFTTGGTVAYQLFWKNWGDPQLQAKVSGPQAPSA